MFKLEKNFLLWDPLPSKGKIFWHQIWLDTCSDWKKKFFVKGPPLSKGTIFWHQIWLDTCSDWKKKIFVNGPPPVKGKFFDTRFGLIHVQTGKKIFCQGTPPSKGKIFLSPDLAWYMFRLEKKFCQWTPPPSKGKIFWHQIWLDTCSDWKKFFFWSRNPPRNSKKLLWPCSGWHASCVHAGGLSCFVKILSTMI